jgi:hypothetical protein
MVEMTVTTDNCAVVAIHAVTGEAREDIAAGIAAFPAYDGGPAFVGAAVKMFSVAGYLESRGWETLFYSDRPAPTIPLTCIIGTQNPDHCFAIVAGLIHDRARVSYDGAMVHFIFVPPASRA